MFACFQLIFRPPERQGGQLKAKLATSKENLPPAAPAASSMQPIRAGAGKNMAMLIQHENSGSNKDLSARKHKRNPREPATVLSTLTSGVPTNATENPMAPSKKKLKHRASEGQAGIVAPSTFDSSLMGAPLPTNLEPSSGQFNSIHSMSTGSNTQGSANGAAPNMTAQMSPTHMQPVTSGLSQQSPLVPTPNTIASQYSSNCYSTPASFNVNEHQDLSTNGFYNQHTTALSFNMNNASSFEEQPHFDNFFDGLSNQDHSSGIAMPSFDLEQDALPVSGKTDLMLPPVNPGTFGEEDSETEDDENQAGDDADQAGNDEGQAGDDEGQAGDDEGQAAGDEYSETEDETDIVASQRDIGGNIADFDDEPSQINSPLLQSHEINEQSPSEDERQALAIVSGPQGGQLDASPSRDVIEEHRRRNRATKPPSEERLLAAAKKQLRQAGANKFTETDACDKSIEADENEGEGVQQHVRATRNSKPSSGPKPKNQSYYPDMWKAAIGDGKILFAKIIALENAFPTKEADLSLASQCLASVITEFKDKGLVFEEGYNQTRTMDGIVFAEGTTYRGKLKKMASDHVDNQQGHLADIAAKVERLVGAQTMFHKDGVDGHGKEHHGLAHHYPNEFKDIVPERAVALVTTAYKTGDRKKVDFTGDDYLKVYRMIIQMIKFVNSKPHRQAKWKECRQQWARAGWAKYGQDDVNDTIFSVDVSD
ncbi:hypothetical protein CPB83DRAFT_900471 [Crepidotus variabilis]|uniref:DUF6532 domain-containing protein n=1 Tax=Crepidotus variabilis TaxID=179855 RepID=A0A9P6JHQ1_9AGAR|nr:hypothetical protein CPB83DRAFT_900471 [Crepidotus variabilis]